MTDKTGYYPPSISKVQTFSELKKLLMFWIDISRDEGGPENEAMIKAWITVYDMISIERPMGKPKGFKKDEVRS